MRAASTRVAEPRNFRQKHPDARLEAVVLARGLPPQPLPVAKFRPHLARQPVPTHTVAFGGICPSPCSEPACQFALTVVVGWCRLRSRSIGAAGPGKRAL